LCVGFAEQQKFPHLLEGELILSTKVAGGTWRQNQSHQNAQAAMLAGQLTLTQWLAEHMNNISCCIIPVTHKRCHPHYTLPRRFWPCACRR
jgi:hypothetical protein